MSDLDPSAAQPLRPQFFAKARGDNAHDDARFRQVVSSESRLALRAFPTWDDGGLQTPDGAQQGERSLPRGGRSTSGRGGADGNPLRSARGRGDLERPNFNIDVPAGGYAWWYVDGVSDDGTRAVSVIGFIGSVFSPWYAWSGRGDPSNNCCINVATYGKGGRFAMTDRGNSALRQSGDCLQVGPSSMRWDNGELIIDINEVSSLPLISRMRGQIRLQPSGVTSIEMPLTPDGAHVWRPFAPSARISVELEAKGWQFDGNGYFDSNFGTRSLEEDFSTWTWARYPTTNGATCFYDANRRDGTVLDAAINFDEDGTARAVSGPPKTSFKRTLWALKRDTRADAGTTPKQVKAMLDAPFYSRSVVQTTNDGERVEGVHEALDLNRYSSKLIKPMLAVRVPRRKNWTF